MENYIYCMHNDDLLAKQTICLDIFANFLLIFFKSCCTQHVPEQMVRVSQTAFLPRGSTSAMVSRSLVYSPGFCHFCVRQFIIIIKAHSPYTLSFYLLHCQDGMHCKRKQRERWERKTEDWMNCRTQLCEY